MRRVIETKFVWFLKIIKINRDNSDEYIESSFDKSFVKYIYNSNNFPKINAYENMQNKSGNIIQRLQMTCSNFSWETEVLCTITALNLLNQRKFSAYKIFEILIYFILLKHLWHCNNNILNSRENYTRKEHIGFLWKYSKICWAYITWNDCEHL